MTKKTFFKQGLILTGISFFLRITNIVYRSYLSQKIGAEGIGLYQLIISIFMLAVTLSTSGISLAVTRMVTAAIVSGRRSEIRSIVGKCFAFCLTISLTISGFLFFASDFCARVLLGNELAAPCLKILGLGLPFMSICTCLRGYFLAVDESVSTGLSDVLENVLTVGLTVFLFWYFAPQGIEKACVAAVVASTGGEVTSFLAGWFAYRKSLRKNTPVEKNKSKGVLHGLTHIALPSTLSSAARSLLNTAENLLIPKELQKFGQSYSASMSQYGMLQGMTMPMLYFPCSFLTSFASLLIPKITREREQNHKNAVEYITGKAITAALVFGIFFAAIFIMFGDDWSLVFYHNEFAGEYLKVLAPIVPLMYLDVVVDSLLKGMDEQFNSMKFNLADSSIRVILVLILLRFFGIESYVGILFFSTIFNASLSLGRLLKVTKVKLHPVRQIVLPVLIAMLSVMITNLFMNMLTTQVNMLTVLIQITIAGLIFIAMIKGTGWALQKSEKSA
ncbi:oligosaccharide flippase family protein [Scatolibacter rhodanostii]|uniref:oligosaccharide flippase family protein n=1 Tax=Scatolibacter rhodanostii TaxID=2014781 RepID=UPI0013566FCD|nr:oligosaccharide flippase family protein [Scatolibacter rhodanostii]